MLRIEIPTTHGKLKGMPESPTKQEGYFWFIMMILSGTGFLLCLSILFG